MPKTEQIVPGEAPRAVEEWLFSILRFAITLDEVDRAAVLAVAAGMDRRGSRFTFFARTTVKIRDAIVAKDCAEAAAALRVFVRAIDHAALRRAFEAVLDIKPHGVDRRTVPPGNREKLWKGLSDRGLRTTSRP